MLLRRRSVIAVAAAFGAATVYASVASATMTRVGLATRSATVPHASSHPLTWRGRPWGTPRLIRVDALHVANVRPSPMVDDLHRRRKHPPGGSPPPTVPPPSGAAQCGLPGPGTNEYSTEGWKVPGARTMQFNPSTTPAGLANVASSLQGALNAWAGADARAPRLTVTTGFTTTSPVADHQDEAMFGALDSSTLSETFTWTWSNGDVESDIVLNSNAAWFQAPSEGSGCYQVAAYDVQDVLAHETGHLYGLGHAPNSPYNTMYPTALTGETYKRSLASGDSLGLNSLY
ncbi:MAG: matrixin family metalloprotease [Acidimicrobiia bacterium]|nr:matrixin family metalloprotease [Acidimicrobiia bacterium]